MRILRASFTLAAVAAAGLFGTALLAAQGNTSPYSDPIGDIDSGITTGGGTLDITGMEISAVGSDLIFALSVNGNVNAGSGGVDWGKFMIGIAPFSATGTTTGNGWARPINMALSPAGSPAPQGMSYWIGSWVDAGGGAQLWTLTGGTAGGGTGGAWSTSSAPGFSITPGASSTLTYTVPMANLGVGPGDTFSFDAYSSGGGGGDTAIDSLANPNVAVTSWGETYTSRPLAFSGPGLNSFTIPVPEPTTMALAVGGAVGVTATGRLLRRRRRKTV